MYVFEKKLQSKKSIPKKANQKEIKKQSTQKKHIKIKSN